MNKQSRLTLLGLIIFSAVMGFVFYSNLMSDTHHSDKNNSVESKVSQKNDSLKETQKVTDSLRK
jgi:hypothetical protein